MLHSGNPKHGRVIFVLGMHRGGTSAVTRALGSLGVALGDNLVPPGEDNPKGFWEDRDFLAINEELLGHLGSSYDRLAPAWRFVESDPAISALKLRAAQLMMSKAARTAQPWGLKDPRTSRLLRFWRDVICSCDLSVSYVIALRNPLSVALSLQKRNHISADKSYILWLQHMLPTVLDTVGFPRVVVDYDLLIDQPSIQIRRMANALDLDTKDEGASAAQAVEAVLAPELRHFEFAMDHLRLDGRVPEDVGIAYDLLRQVAKDERAIDEAGVQQRFEAMDLHLRAYSSIFRHVNELEDDKIGLYTTLGERDSRVSALTQVVSGSEVQIAQLKEELSHWKETRIGELSQIAAERETHVRALLDRAAGYAQEVAALRASNADLTASLSWRITAPLRYVFSLLLELSRKEQPILSEVVPPPPAVPQRPSFATLVEGSPQSADWTGDYVEDTPPPGEISSDVRLVAFYLPQFHPIPENDQAWGKGFTEWTNVSRAKPQFDGHYQPHLPGELGYYDLRVKEVQARQVALARRYGVGAFCFYFYWFGGKVLLDLPLRQYLDNPELNLPFCLCWANENWTRRWDGVDDEVIIAQKHSPDDDLAFIEHVGQYMRDPRYLCVNGHPVLLVYQPSLLPNARETAARWRKWAMQNGLGGLYLICIQSLDASNPAEYGFDAASEFPPNLTGPPIITDSIRPYNPAFSGVVYDLSALVDRSRQYSAPSYKLFRGVCPSWDNTPRRRDGGAAFLRYSPRGYCEWLQNAIVDTRQRFSGDERLVFVNAWNEWAEGAHLEPDQRYGYAWLQATREALSNSRGKQPNPLARVVVVTHDAHKHGAQFTALNLTRELVETLGCQVEVVCLGEGALKEEFARYAKVHDLSGVDPYSPAARNVASDLFARGFDRALVNTTVGGHFLVTLKQAGVRCVALVHELRELILSFKLETHARALAEHADWVVFGAREVRDAFCEFGHPRPERVVIRPQGVLKRNYYCAADSGWARQALRRHLGVPENTSIVIGVGHADLRKGIDYFLELASVLRDSDPLIHLVWVGSFESHVAALANKNPEVFRQVHFTGYQEDPALYYAGADVFALTSREDPLPSVLLEAMAAGLPVVGFAGSGGANALIDEGVGSNVPMGDCRAFADAIVRILSNTAQRDAMAQRGRDVIAERFSWRHYAFDLLELAGVPLRKISVVVPNYNYERYLTDRLSTILKQTYPIYELIFLDDASTDNSLTLAKRLLAKSTIDYRIIANDSNSGSVFRQWKRGVEQARGDIVWIAEADDMSEPEFLATVVRGFEDPDVVMSYCESKQIDQDGLVCGASYQDYVSDLGGERWQEGYVSEGEHEIRNYLAVKNTIPNVSAALMRRNALIQALNEHPDVFAYKVAGDWKVYVHLLATGRLAFFPLSLNHHRRHQAGVTINEFNESQYIEIQNLQKFVASQYQVSTDVAILAQNYLRVVRRHFGLDPEVGELESRSSTA